MKVNPSALKHGISEADALQAASEWEYAGEPDGDMPAKQLRLGFDTQGRLLEVVVGAAVAVRSASGLRHRALVAAR